MTVPVQELPENQAPEVAYNLIEQTGEKIPREVGTVVVEEPVEEEKPKRRGRKKAGEAAVEEAVVGDALPRELGS